MIKHFYSHIVETDSIVMALSQMEMSETERAHLLSLVESHLHHVILDAVLSELSEKDKETFLRHVAANNHEKVWLHLNTKVANIEEKIKKAADDLKKSLHEDIKEVKKKK